MKGDAILALEDGTIFYGESVGATGVTSGECVFNTAMTGYQEVLINRTADQEPENTKMITAILANLDIHGIWHSHLSNVDQLRFFYVIAIKSIDSCTIGQYTDFDAHTTSNCCHGMAIFAQNLIESIAYFDLKSIRFRLIEKLNRLSNKLDHSNFELKWLPKELICLVSLYALAFIGDIDPQKGRRTNPKKLKSLEKIGTKFCEKLIRDLQKVFSNIVANSYHFYLQAVPKNQKISDVPVAGWGKYVSPTQLRSDKRGVQYAPCMFSMQVSLAYLSYSKVKIAIVNDLISPQGVLRSRYISLLEGDGSGFSPISANGAILSESYDVDEPIIVFGGCAISDKLSTESLSEQMQEWMHKFSSLILACDIHYPHFPQVTEDLDLNDCPITPCEESLKIKLEEMSHIEGVSSQDPSFFFLTHIYPASVRQVVCEKKVGSALPLSSIYTPALILN